MLESIDEVGESLEEAESWRYPSVSRQCCELVRNPAQQPVGLSQPARPSEETGCTDLLLLVHFFLYPPPCRVTQVFAPMLHDTVHLCASYI